ncbi:recombinase RarA, partial [Staphylococcus pseudintermedius]
HPNGFVAQQYLPELLKNRQYYTPKETSKSEQQFKQIYDNIRQQQNEL